MPRYFDSAYSNVGSAELKPMVKAWGGDPKMRKEECIAYLRAVLNDPKKVQATLASLQLWERNALALIKRAGGAMDGSMLMIGLVASSEHPKRPISHYRSDFTKDLFHHGLILATDERSPEYFGDSGYGRSRTVYSDERILAQVGLPEYLRFDLQPENLPGEVHFRRPSAVTLDVLAILQAFENMGGLKLAQNGTLRASDEAKLCKAMRWLAEGMDVDGLLFPNPAQAWVESFGFSNLLKKADDGQLRLAESPTQFAQRPFGEQVRLLMDGLIHAKNWWELSNAQSYWDSYGSARERGRLALTLALSALPVNSDGFYSMQKFELAFFQRIGNHFSLGYIPSYPLFYRETPVEQEKQINEWHHRVRSEWIRQEVPWLICAFTTWLYFLGLVELLIDGGKLTGFRLTEIGRETFHPELAPVKLAESSTQAAPTGPVWVVQPNFDIIVYMDRVSAPQLAFIERCAERSQAQKHTAHYRLTRESVYSGLESGLSFDELVSTLQTGSQTELSQNILVELREWASLRERIFLRRQANLLEFPSPQALTAGLAQGIKGTIVAERFLLLHHAPSASGWDEINYAETLPANLKLDETGEIKWKPGKHRDLMTAAHLKQWAESTANDEWQLTRASVGKALKPGKKLSGLLNLLQTRVSPRGTVREYELPPPAIPPLLELALRSWAGKSYPITLQNVILIRCPNEKTYQAVISSPLMSALLIGHEPPNLLFADPAQAETLRQRLDWLGWKASE